MAKRTSRKNASKNGTREPEMKKLEQENQRLRSQVERLRRDRRRLQQQNEELQTELQPLKQSMLTWAKEQFAAEPFPRTKKEWEEYVASQKWYTLDEFWDDVVKATGQKP